MENTGPGYGTDINVPVYATVKGVGIDIVCLFFVYLFAYLPVFVLIFGFFACNDLMIDETINVPV